MGTSVLSYQISVSCSYGCLYTGHCQPWQAVCAHCPTVPLPAVGGCVCPTVPQGTARRGRLCVSSVPQGTASRGRLCLPTVPQGTASHGRLCVPTVPQGTASHGRLCVPTVPLSAMGGSVCPCSCVYPSIPLAIPVLAYLLQSVCFRAASVTDHISPA